VNQATTTAKAPSKKPAAAAAAAAPAAAAPASPAQSAWDVQRLMEVRSNVRATKKRIFSSFVVQVLSIDRGRAVDLLKQNNGSVDAAIGWHFRTSK
jgi:hypothetical protein